MKVKAFRLVRTSLILLVLAAAASVAVFKPGPAPACAAEPFCCSACYETCDASYYSCIEPCGFQVGSDGLDGECMNNCARQRMRCENRCLSSCDTSC